MFKEKKSVKVSYILNSFYLLKYVLNIELSKINSDVLIHAQIFFAEEQFVHHSVPIEKHNLSNS